MIGTELRHARELQEWSLGAISRRTKIPVSILNAIDRDEFSKVPAGLVRRGFLRAYAKEVGLDPEETVELYRAEFEPPAQLETESVELPDEAQRDITAPEMDKLKRPLLRGRWWGSAAIGLVGAVVYVMLARHNGSTVMNPTTDAGEHRTGILGVASNRDSDEVVPSGTARASGSALHVEIQPGGPCWIAATSDGRPAVQRLMNVGDREILEANDETILRVGDAGACAFSINGAAAIPAGPAGQPVTLRVTKENYQQLIAGAVAARTAREVAVGAPAGSVSQARAAGAPSDPAPQPQAPGVQGPTSPAVATPSGIVSTPSGGAVPAADHESLSSLSVAELPRVEP